MDGESFFHRACVLDGSGGGRDLDADQSGRWMPEHGLLLVVLDRHSPQTRAWLRHVAALPPLMVDSILAHDPRPHCLSRREGLLVTLRGVNLTEGGSPEDMVALRGWFDADRAILLRGRKVFAVDDLWTALAGRVGPSRSAEVLVRLVDALTDHIAHTADEMGRESDALEDAALAGRVPSDMQTRSGSLRSRSMTMRRHIVPQRDMLGRMASEPSPLLTDDDRTRLREDAEQLARVVDELDLVRERLLLAQEQLAARVSERLSRNTYLLGVMAAIFLPLGFITALAGVSIAGIPGQNHPLAFWVLCGLLAVVLVLEILLLRRMRWM